MSKRNSKPKPAWRGRGYVKSMKPSVSSFVPEGPLKDALRLLYIPGQSIDPDVYLRDISRLRQEMK